MKQYETVRVWSTAPMCKSLGSARPHVALDVSEYGLILSKYMTRIEWIRTSCDRCYVSEVQSLDMT